MGWIGPLTVILDQHFVQQEALQISKFASTHQENKAVSFDGPLSDNSNKGESDQ
jgi:hypothetical protein